MLFPSGKAFRKQLESLNRENCFIDAASRMLEDFHFEVWGVDLRMRLVGAWRLAVLLESEVGCAARFPKALGIVIAPSGTYISGKQK